MFLDTLKLVWEGETMKKNYICLGIGGGLIAIALILMFLNVLFEVSVSSLIVSIIMIVGIALIIVYYQIESEQRRR